MLSVGGSLEWSITLHYLTAVNMKASLLWVLETECLKVTFTDRCAVLCLRTLWMCTDRCTFSLIAHLQSAIFTPLCLSALVNSVAHLQILLTRAVSKVFGVPFSVVLLRWVGWTILVLQDGGPSIWLLFVLEVDKCWEHCFIMDSTGN